MKKIHIYRHFIGKFTYIERKHIFHLEYVNVLYGVSLYKSNSYSISGIILNLRHIQDGHKLFNVSVCLRQVSLR